MEKNQKEALTDFRADNSGGWLPGFLAEEDSFDRGALWRLGSWAMAAVGAMMVAALASKSYLHVQRNQVVAADLERQSRQIQRMSHEAQTEARRLSSAIETLNTDRDRLYSRVMTLEQGLESVTGSIGRQVGSTPAGSSNKPDPAPEASNLPGTAEPSPVAAIPASVAAPPARQLPSAPNITLANAGEATEQPSSPAAISTAVSAAQKLSPPDIAATKLEATSQKQSPSLPGPAGEPAQASAKLETTPEVAVPHTRFGVDLGGASSIQGLRTLWRRVASSAELAGLQPMLSVQERPLGAKISLRLVAGPLDDAAAAARICAAMATRHHGCETAVFDGQRLALDVEPTSASHVAHRRASPQVIKRQPLKPPQPAAPATSSSTR